MENSLVRVFLFEGVNEESPEPDMKLENQFSCGELLARPPYVNIHKQLFRGENVEERRIELVR